jgi:hypothetical protein
MTVRAKFKVHYVEKRADGSEGVHMHQVYTGREETGVFFPALPAGQTLMIAKGEAVGKFEAEQEYYLELTPVDKGHQVSQYTMQKLFEDVESRVQAADRQKGPIYFGPVVYGEHGERQDG